MKLVIDTNILFSALVRNSITRKIILSDVFEIHVPEYLFEEIDKHKEEILKKAGMGDREFNALLTLLQKHVKIVRTDVYQNKISLAEETMKEVDETDSPFLALALELDCHLWSNDKHFEGQNLVRAYTTKDVLELLKKDV